jgi:hypothetical protein
LKNQVVDINFGGRKCDISIKTNSGQQIKIEVKATGKSAFEYFGEKDISADYLVWVSFGDFFLNTTKNPVDVLVVKTPSNYFKKPIKITLSKLKESIGNNLETFNLEIDKF